MRLPLLLALALPLLTGCGNTKSPERPKGNGDGGKVTEAVDCASIAPKIRGLYKEAALTESVAEDLADEYVEANLHMVLKDCNANPNRVLPCLNSVANLSDLEANCLIPLDEEGMVEGEHFGSP